MLIAVLTFATLSWPPAHSGTRASVGDRWRVWPAGRIFPASVPGTSPSGAAVRYRLTGVATEVPCDRGLQPDAARALRPFGCLTILRATYADGTQTYVATAGIAVLSDKAEGASSSAARRLGTRPTGGPRLRPPSVRPAGFAGGAAEGFGERQYVAGALAGGDDRYVVLTSAGYADGRPYTSGTSIDSRLTRVARELATTLHRDLTR
ncbi:hypothetical protein [Spongiactinospora sp. TRM90649]|uniref:hypothetical protein n=1 Tax=Spongiactinospora sp. TRM90649 TaxID=3031114 RepID=UPI0023F8E260|nr:hypothetical protein [Spongiactinospora sp. TRM90649]MDF5757838.1 hypothetical protein [Spongiactinospora sp. TRM90649]